MRFRTQPHVQTVGQRDVQVSLGFSRHGGPPHATSYAIPLWRSTCTWARPCPVHTRHVVRRRHRWLHGAQSQVTQGTAKSHNTSESGCQGIRTRPLATRTWLSTGRLAPVHLFVFTDRELRRSGHLISVRRGGRLHQGSALTSSLLYPELARPTFPPPGRCPSAELLRPRPWSPSQGAPGIGTPRPIAPCTRSSPRAAWRWRRGPLSS